MEILNTYPETMIQWHYFIPSIVAGIILVLSIIFSIICQEIEPIVYGIILSGLTWLFVLIWTSSDVPTGKNILQVTLNDSMSLSEFAAKYEILDQEGLIYTIVEKDKD